ncbi:ATP-dependent DNA helicase Rep [Mesobacillus campisalis]|uniref:DNA 3'-5' helicase n=1 Tax=Mesobacillus campisalis TaxID=1408103 RepID=A0A0M2STG9_9BACI|nr:ATP-dependent helicase [Mesobacillus campisalis]KKK37001.1 ATP-dependent DNA helicase Rep [Mesobacillus campisalis]
MQTAYYKEKIINLPGIRREDFQKLYEDGKKGLLSCPVCGAPVRLYLGIHNRPHFYHHLSKAAACSDLPIQDAAEEHPEHTEWGGFRLPTARGITAEEKEVAYKPSQALRIKRPFTKKPVLSSEKQDSYIEKLKDAGISFDSNQQTAVTHTEGPLLILAGAGSGKTRVLTARTAYILKQLKVPANSMMLVTFTAKAAGEMKKRLIGYPGVYQDEAQRIVSGTFHSIFYKILLHHNRDKWSGEHLLKKDWQREQIVKDAGRTLSLDEKEFAYDLALQQIGLWKNSMILPKGVKPQSSWEEKTALLYQHYEETKDRSGLFDFDDMLLGCHSLFVDEPQLLESYQNRFTYFLIDEFQDINKVQYELIKMLSARTNNVCAVGDDDQSIYAFRGSDPSYLLEFERDFPGAEVVTLNQNYRSPHEIVETANSIIAGNTKRHQKEMKAQYSHEIKPMLFYPFDEEEEATMILTDLQEKIEQGAKPSHFAILFRTNTGSRAMFERLASSSLPFKLEQDNESFYERFMVRGLLAYFRLAINEDDSEAVRSILPSLFLKQSVFRDLQAESILKDCSMLEALSHVKTGFAFQEQKLKKLVPMVRSLAMLSPLAAIERVEKELGYQDFIKKRGSEGNKMEKGSDDIRDLRVAARKFKNISELIDHADHMTAMNKEIKVLGKRHDDAVILSTIHRSKGLEYKYVYVLGAVDGSLPHDYALDSARNGDLLPLEEERRLLYVAVTRAMEQLFISVPIYRRGRKAHPSRFLTQLPKIQ